MIDKIVISGDKKNGVVHFDDNNSFLFYHSDGKVVELITEMILEPKSIIDRSYEDTLEIVVQLSFFDKTA